jgi:hypothetical protein
MSIGATGRRRRLLDELATAVNGRARKLDERPVAAAAATACEVVMTRRRD